VFSVGINAKKLAKPSRKSLACFRLRASWLGSSKPQDAIKRENMFLMHLFILKAVAPNAQH
jgi:hypothetical protein